MFRVAADSSDVDVICPSCHETLRLPKTPDERQHATPAPDAMPSQPPRDMQPAVVPTQAARQPAESSVNGRPKFAPAILVPLAIIAALLVFKPWKRTGSSGLAPEVLPPDPPKIITPAAATPATAPPPPPVAVNEMPVSEATPEPPPTLPEPQLETLETPPQEPAAADSTIAVSPSPAPVIEDEELVEAVPADSGPAPVEKPLPSSATQAGASPRSHTVVRGDTLVGIARKYRVDPRAIVAANGMKNEVVYLGSKLVIPTP